MATNLAQDVANLDDAVRELQKDRASRELLQRLRTRVTPEPFLKAAEAHWAREIVRATQPEGQWTHGGDRTSASYRDAKQQALAASRAIILAPKVISRAACVIILAPAGRNLESSWHQR